PDLDIQVFHIQRIVFDELAPRFDILAHKRGKDGFRLGNILELNLKQRALFRIHRRLPELWSSHLAQTLISLYLIVLLALLIDVLEELACSLFLPRISHNARRALY